jgi:hypothetical protein
MTAPDRPPLPELVNWPIFPFEGDLLVKPLATPWEKDRVRSGEEGGPPCESCGRPDDDYIWVDDHWRVSGGRPTGLPAQVFLEARDHVDNDELDDERAAELGQLLVRLDKAMQAIGNVGRVHFSRWGDGASHFHIWFFARPAGNWQMLGLFLPIWASIYPTTPDDVWQANLKVIAAELAKDGGRAAIT